MFLLYVFRPSSEPDKQIAHFALWEAESLYRVYVKLPIGEDPETWGQKNEAYLRAQIPDNADLLDLEEIIHRLWDRKAIALWLLDYIGHPINLFIDKPQRIVLKALALTILDEINILRENAGLVPRTVAQLETAIKNKLITLLR